MSSIKCITLEEEMKKNSELKISDIQILREWCEKQLHLPKIQDVQLAIFLHSNYYQIEPTKSTIENYFTIRTHIPEIFSNRDIFKVKRLRKHFYVVAYFYLEENTKEGYHIMMRKIIDSKPSHYDLNDDIKCCFMILDEFIWTHGSTAGCIIIIDVAGLLVGHLTHVNPTLIKKYICYVQDALPIRLLEKHIINTSPIFEVLFNVVKPFINKELLSLTHFQSSVKNASKYFPIDALPNEYGGKADPVQDLIKAHVKKLENFCEWFLEDEKVNRVNESMRIGKTDISNKLFGTEGSLKKIEID